MAVDWSYDYEAGVYETRVMIVTTYLDNPGSGRIISYYIERNSIIITQFSSLSPACHEVLKLLANLLYCYYIKNQNEVTMSRYNMDNIVNGQVYGYPVAASDKVTHSDWIGIVKNDWLIESGVLFSNSSLKAWVKNSTDESIYCISFFNQGLNSGLQTPHTGLLDDHLIVIRLDQLGIKALSCDMTSVPPLSNIPQWVELDIVSESLNLTGWVMTASEFSVFDNQLVITARGTDNYGVTLTYLIWYRLHTAG